MRPLHTDGGDAGWSGAGFALLKATVFVVAMLVLLAAVLAFPQIATFLPSLMGR